MVIQLNSSVIWQKGKSPNGGNKNTKHVKFSNFPKNERFLPPDTHTYVCVSGGKKRSFFGKFGVLLYSCYLLFEIRPFAILLTKYNSQNKKLWDKFVVIYINTFSMVGARIENISFC